MVEGIKKVILKTLENGPLETKKLVFIMTRYCVSEGRDIYGPDDIISTLYELCAENKIECFSRNGAIFYKLI
jgi:hypothetical protein